jgi:translocation and assembly module TamB
MNSTNRIHRKRAIRVALIGIPALLLLLVVAGVLILRTHTFTRLLLAKIVQKAEQSTGAHIAIQKLDVHWFPFTADVYGVVVHGQEKGDEAPLLQAEHLGVSLGIRALLNKEVDLYSVNVDRPIVNLRVDSRGNTNLPKAPPSQSSSNLSVIVRHASLRDGTVIYNDEQIPLAAELDDFRAMVQFDSAADKYRGSLGYRQGRIVTKTINPLEHNARVEFTANRDGIVLDPIVVSSGKTRLAAHLNLMNFANPAIEGQYDGFIVTRELAEILKDTSLPRGDITVSGTLRYQSVPKESFLKAVQVTGRFDSRALTVRESQVSTSLQSIHGIYRLQDGNLRVEKLDADVLEGHLSARMDMLHLDQNPISSVNATVRGVSLEKLSDALPASRRQSIRLLGRMNLSAQANWSSNISAVKARTHVEFSGPTTLPAQANQIPVNGIVDVDYDGAKQSAFFGRSDLRIANTEMALSGVLSRQSNLNIDVNAKDLHELTVLASAFSSANSPNAQSVSAPYALRGAARFDGQITGPTGDPRIRGQLSGSNLEVQGSKWRTVRVNLDAASSGVRFQNGYLQSAQQGEISFNGSTGLQWWSFTPESPLSLQAKVTKLSVADLERLAKAEYPITGDLSGEIALTGSERQPVGHGSLQLTKGSAWNEPVRNLRVDFQGDRETVHSTAELQVAAGKANAKLTYVPKTEHYDMTLTADGLKLDQLQSVQHRAGSLSGVLSLNVSGEGTVKDPQLSGNVEIPQLQISGQTFSGVKAQMDLAHQRANVSLESIVEQGYVHAQGGIDLVGQYQTDATVDVRALPIGPLLAKHSTTTGAAQDLQGFTEIHASLKGPLKDPSRLNGSLEIPRLNLAYKNIQLANDGPLRIRYQNGVATVEQARIKGTGTDLSFQGVIPVQSTIPLNVSAKGGVDVQLLQLLSPDVIASGKLEIDLREGGAITQPKTEGSVRIVNAGLSVEDAPVSLSAMNGQLSIVGNELHIDKLNATAGGGTISANGSATYGKETNFAIDLHAKGVRVHPTGIRSTVDGDLQLNGTPQKSQLSGRMVVDRLSFQEGFDLATFMSQFSDDSTVSAPSPFESNMNLSISVNSAQNLTLASSQVSIAGSTNLSVTGTAAHPVILGRITLTNGELFFQGKRFEIQSGTIAFVNPARTEPVLNLYVKTTIEQYNITINFSGPIDRLKTNYTSDPSLPPIDIINLLAFGQTTAERASNASAPSSLAAQSVLAQGVASQVAKGVQNLAGISQLTIDPTAGTSQNPGAQVAIQQRVTGTILLTFATDVTSTQTQTIQVQYQPKQHWRISVIRDQYDGYGVDVRYHKVF